VSQYRVYSVITPAGMLKSQQILQGTHMQTCCPPFVVIVRTGWKKDTRGKPQTIFPNVMHALAHTHTHTHTHTSNTHTLRDFTVTLWRYPKLTDMYTRRYRVYWSDLFYDRTVWKISRYTSIFHESSLHLRPAWTRLFGTAWTQRFITCEILFSNIILLNIG